MTMESNTTAQYTITDKVLVIQMSAETFKKFQEAYADDGTLDFAELGENDMKILSELDITGPAEIQA